jgi:hypothetical protein
MEENTTRAEDAPFRVITTQQPEPSLASESDPRPLLGWTAWIREGLRASTFRAVRDLPEGPRAWPMLLIVAATTAILIGASRFEVAGPASFDMRTWLFGWAPTALLICGVWLVLNWARQKTTHASPVAAWFLLYSVATVPLSLVGIGLGVLTTREDIADWWSQGHWSAWAIYSGMWVLLLMTTWRVSRAVTRSTGAAASLLGCVFIVQLVSSWQLHTQAWEPVASYDDADDEYASLEVSQEVFESQQAMLQGALQTIAPSTGNERQVYGLVYAPYSEDVFLRESAMVKEVLEERFRARDRIVRLVNNRATATELPWATTLNLERSLKALAEAMDKDRDVLVVYLTSHGGADFKLAAEHWPLEVKDLTAEQLRKVLDDLGVRNRVIAVSACYSGGWVEPLQSADTLIMTAADKEHTSYGCGSKSPLTFFGRAVFDEQLRKTRSFEEAFHAAVPLIKQREIEAKKDDGFSNPQIHVGANIRIVLDELVQQSLPSVAGASP